jgi:3-methyladenine DNA glycosylase AlkD
LQGKDQNLLMELAESENMWERRIAIVATWYFIRQNDFIWTYKIAKLLLNDKQDLIHKAFGWMLREAGERDQLLLSNFLELYASKIPRTMLRYAIEKFPENERKAFLAIKLQKKESTKS